MTTGKPEHDKPPSEKEVMSSDSAARRHALAVLAKHAAYTAPAVLAILSISVPKAKAGSF
jgi:hypothetical protein